MWGEKGCDRLLCESEMHVRRLRMCTNSVATRMPRVSPNPKYSFSVSSPSLKDCGVEKGAVRVNAWQR